MRDRCRSGDEGSGIWNCYPCSLPDASRMWRSGSAKDWDTASGRIKTEVALLCCTGRSGL
jgi:hypothetical protein